MALGPLEPLNSLDDPFYSKDATNPASAYYVPPAGMYQNNAGQSVPNSTPNTSTFGKVINFLSGTTPSTLGTTPLVTEVQSNVSDKILGIDLEDVIFMVLGLLLIGAGIFAFKQTQTVIESGAKIAKVAGEAAA